MITAEIGSGANNPLVSSNSRPQSTVYGGLTATGERARLALLKRRK